MKLPVSSHHARVVALGGIDKRKGVSSRANLLISLKVLMGNIATSGHQAKVVSLDQLLEIKRNKKDKKTIKTRPGQRIGGLITSQPIRSMIIQRYDTTSIWSPRQGSGSWWHSQEKGGLITSQPFISVKCLWLTLPPLVTKPRQCPLISIMEKMKIKRHEWAWKYLHP